MQANEQIMPRSKQSLTDQQFISLVEKEVNCDDELLSHQDNAELEQDVFDGIDPPKLIGSELFQPLFPLSQDDNEEQLI